MATARDKEKKRRAVVSAKKMAETSANKQSKALKLPPGAKMFYIKKAGNITLSIVPYEAGEGNPGADQGEMAVGRTYWVHGGVGPNRDTYLCNAQALSKPCYCCDKRAKLDRDEEADKEEEKKLRPKKRQLWNVLDHDNEEKGTQVFDFAAPCFGDHLFAKVDRKPQYDSFASADEGFQLEIGVTEEKGAGYKYFDCGDIEFKKREALSDETLEQAVCLDDMLEEADYEELKRVYESGDAEDDEDADDKDEDKPAARRGRDEPKEETADDAGIKVGMEVDHEKLGLVKVLAISDDGLTMKVKDSDGDVHKGIPPSQCALVKEKEKDPEPRKQPTKEDDDKEAEKTFGGGFEVGETVTFTYRDKERTGKIVKVNTRKELAEVQCKDRDDPYTVDWEELKRVKEDKESGKPAKGSKGKTAEDLGIKVGTFVVHEDFGRCEVVSIRDEGKLLTLEDSDNDVHSKVPVADVIVRPAKEKEPEENGKAKDKDEDKPTARRGSSRDLPFDEAGDDKDEKKEKETAAKGGRGRRR